MISIDDIIKIREQVKAKQNKKRYEHTLGVAYTAAALAFMYDIDPLKAELAGVLHDCAKCMSDDELITECHKSGIHLSKEEIESPQVIHAIYGSVLARKKYGIKDKDIINAVRYHTTGRDNMSLLEKIIFTADYIEPLRCEAPHLEELRKLAFTDIDECVYSILSQTVSYLEDLGKQIVTDTLKAYQWYKNERENDNE